MFFIKRIITIVSAILGASFGLILLSFINWAFSLSITFSYVFIAGVGFGAIGGVLTAYLLTRYLMNKARKFVEDRNLKIDCPFYYVTEYITYNRP